MGRRVSFLYLSIGAQGRQILSNNLGIAGKIVHKTMEYNLSSQSVWRWDNQIDIE